MADAQDSKSCEVNFMWVQVPPPAPIKIKGGEISHQMFSKTKIEFSRCERFAF